LERFVVLPTIHKRPEFAASGTETLAEIALLLGKRCLQNPREEFLVTLSESFLNGIIRIHVHQAIMLIPPGEGIPQ